MSGPVRCIDVECVECGHFWTAILEDQGEVLQAFGLECSSCGEMAGRQAWPGSVRFSDEEAALKGLVDDSEAEVLAFTGPKQ